MLKCYCTTLQCRRKKKKNKQEKKREKRDEKETPDKKLKHVITRGVLLCGVKQDQEQFVKEPE